MVGPRLRLGRVRDVQDSPVPAGRSSGAAMVRTENPGDLRELITLQNQTDGMWRSELFTPAWNKEASGSGFFCYELFYALRNGIIDTATYLGPAKKAWEGLIGCVGMIPRTPIFPAGLKAWAAGRRTPLARPTTTNTPKALSLWRETVLPVRDKRHHQGQ